MYGKDNITLLITWIPVLEQHVSYNITTTAHVHTIIMTRSRAAQLTLPYNAMFDVTIVATLCQQSNSTNITGLKYGILYTIGNNYHQDEITVIQ